MRGNRALPEAVFTTPGSIPACAGEPAPGTHRTHLGWVYPRVCGGTDTIRFNMTEKEGLSPRVRGNLPADARRRTAVGSIPACAGEPRYPTSAPSSLKVYPRVCGGTVNDGLVHHLPLGLSPRVRGNQLNSKQNRESSRSIPACAGEPLVNVIEHALLYSYLEYY